MAENTASIGHTSLAYILNCNEFTRFTLYYTTTPYLRALRY
jgi:hypothetical protein